MIQSFIPPIIGVLHLITLVLHLFVQYTIYKAKLRNNQYFLLQMLSLVDMAIPLLGLVLFSLMLTGYDGILNRGSLVTSMLDFLFHFLSISITLIIAMDRALAVKYALHYESMVTKQRLVYTILLCGLLNLIVLGGLFFGFGYREVTKNAVIVANKGI